MGAGRQFERVADYQFAAPDGMRWLALYGVDDHVDVVPPVDDDTEATLYEQVSPAEGWLEVSGPSTGEVPTGTAILLAVMDVEPSALELFHAWYDEEHLPGMVAVPGILAARRFHAIAGAGAAEAMASTRERFAALYELRDGDVFQGPEWEAVSSVTPRTAEVMPHLRWASQLYRLVSAPGQ